MELNMKTLNLQDLTNPASDANEDSGPDRATFIAEPLTLTLTRPDGSVVVQTVLEARGFKAKEDKRSGKTHGGIGWYGDMKAADGATYMGLPLSTGFRVSVSGVKVAPGTVVDLTPDSDDE